MDRSFLLITALASTLTFAGVWTATKPVGTVTAPAAAAGTPSPISAIPHSDVAVPQPSIDAGPYNVVRSPDFAVPNARTIRAESGGAVFYRGCREARAAGVTPMHAGEPGYRVGMDGDGDGIACEDYRP